MGSTTTRAALRYPLGSDDNDVVTDMQNLANDVDAAMAMMSQGLLSARGTANKGRKFYWASDDRGGKLFLDDGAVWQEIGPGPVAGPMSGYTGLITSAPSAALADVTLSARAKASQTGDIFRAEGPVGTPTYVKIDSTGIITAENMKLTGGSSFFLQVASFAAFGLGALFDGETYVKVGSTTNAAIIQSMAGTNSDLQLQPGGSGRVRLMDSGNLPYVDVSTSGLGFHGVSPSARYTVTGSRGGNAALASLLTAMATKGLIYDSTVA